MRDERVGWVSRNRNTDPSTSGIAVGFEGLEQGVGLDLVPSVSIRQRHYFNPADRTTDTEPSLDLFYKITPSLTGSLTLNTDFSATEVDDRQINLTRFGLFFPEKREFFLQDADIFEFGGLEQNGRPFFSRSIGLAPTGELLDLDVGAKLTGRVGRFNIGALSVRQGQTGAVPADNATVARISANLLAESSVGMILTEGDPGTTVHNSVAGADFLYRNSRLPGNKLLEINAWAQQSDTEGVTGGQKAYGWRVAMPNNTGWRGGIRFSELGENFNPGFGFVNSAASGSGTSARSTRIGHATERSDRCWPASTPNARSGSTASCSRKLSAYRLMELESRLGDKLAVQYVGERRSAALAVRHLPRRDDPGRLVPFHQLARVDGHRGPTQGLGQRRVSDGRVLRGRPHGDLGLGQLAADGTAADVGGLRVQRHRSTGRQLRDAARAAARGRGVLVEALVGHAHSVRQRVGARMASTCACTGRRRRVATRSS